MYKAEEDYIKYIYEQSVHSSIVTIKDVALKFNYTEQSVYEMIKKLQNKNLLNYVPYQGIKLNKKGLDQAIRMIRAHRIWEVFLQDYLGYDWHEVHEEAEMLEHAGSELMLEKLYAKLGAPQFCQHGNPIPNFDNKITEINNVSMSEVLEGQLFKILRVSDDKPLLTFLKEKNISRNDVIFVYKKYENHGLIEVENFKSEKVVVTSMMAQMIFGERVD